jgi:hypothetical protein
MYIESGTKVVLQLKISSILLHIILKTVSTGGHYGGCSSDSPWTLAERS